MRYLLDTHTFLWFINNDPNLSQNARGLIVDADNELWVSIGSIWEMAIKVSSGKLNLPSPYAEFVDQQLRLNDFELLNIIVQHLGALITMPFHHKDPFDRLLIAQAKVEDVPIISRDVQFDAYGIKRVW